MQTVEETTIQQFPSGFLAGLSQDLAEEVYQALRAWGLPDEIKQAIDTAIYLEMLAGYHDPATFAPGGPEGLERETVGAVKDAACLLESVADLRADKVRSLTPEEYQERRKAKGAK